MKKKKEKPLKVLRATDKRDKTIKFDIQIHINEI